MNFNNKTSRYKWSLQQAGFSLIELMIVVAIVAVLASIAIPTYSNYVVRTNRVSAESCLSNMANYMERYYTTNLKYTGAALPALDCKGTGQTGNDYNYVLASATTSKYTLQAVPINSQLTRDKKCGTLSLDQTGTRGKTGTAPIEKCW